MSSLGASVLTGLRNFSRIVGSCTTLGEAVSSAVEVKVCDITVPGGRLGTNGFLRFEGTGEYLNNTGAINCITFRVYYGGTVVGQITTAAINQSASCSGMRLYTEISALGATNAQGAVTTLGYQTGAGGGLAGTCDFGITWRASFANALTVDSTAQQPLALTATHTTSASTLAFRLRSAHVEQVPGS